MNTLHEILLEKLDPSPTNPRKDFTSPAAVAYLHELAGTIRKKGVLQPILVRPMYCVGTRTREAIDKRREACDLFQIIAGECRWRASDIAQKVDGNRLTIPSIVTEMTDDDAEEAQLIENLQRRDLTAMEEAADIARMLALQNDDGSARYTIESLAEKLGHEPTWVYKRKELLKLPTSGKEALAAGTLTPKVARVIITVPGEQAREDFCHRVLFPEMLNGPLTHAAAIELRDDQFAKALKGAPFKLEDATLVPAAGACLACPKMSANCAQLFEGDDTAHLKQRTCLEPACYQAKLVALQKRQIEEAEAAGKKMLSSAEAAKVYPFFTLSGEMDPKSPYVQIGKKPAEFLLKKEVTKVPTWEKLVDDAEEKTGAKVPRVLIADQDGVVREHVETRLAMAAIEKAGEPIFREAAGAGSSGTPDSFALNKKAEAERAKVQWAVAKASLDAVWAALLNGWDTAAVWNELFYIAMTHAGDHGLALIAKWRGVTIGDGEFAKSDAIEIMWNGMKDAERDALIPLLLVAGGMKESGAAFSDFTNLGKALKVDLDAVAKKATAEFKMKESGARLKPAELKEKVRELLREKKTPVAIACALGLSMPKCGRILDQIEKEQAEAAAGPAAKGKQPGKELGDDRPKGRELEPDELEEFEEKWKDKSARDIAYRFGITPKLAKWYLALMPVAAEPKGEADPKILAQWVKAHAKGMKPEEIARSYKANLDDVLGALGQSPKPIAESPKSGPASAEPAAARGAKKPAKEDIETKVRELRAKGKTFTDIYLETKMSRPGLKVLLKKIDAEKGAVKK